MRRFLTFLFLLPVICSAADRITATITVTNTPSDGDTIVVNSDTRTWKDTVATPASQIDIGASIGANTTNMYNQFLANTFVPWNTIKLNGTNAVDLVGLVGNALVVTDSGDWGEISYSTNTVTTAYAVRVPASIESAGNRAYIADELVDYIGTYASTNVFASTNLALTNFVNLDQAQTIDGAKTYSGDLTYSGTQTGMSITNSTWKTIGDSGTNIFGKIRAFDTSENFVSELRADDDGYFEIVGNDGAALTFTPTSDKEVLTKGMADNIYPLLTGANNFTGTNEFTRITNSTIVGATITESTYTGTIGNLTNGTIVTPTISTPTITAATISGDSTYSGDFGTVTNGTFYGDQDMQGDVDFADDVLYEQALETSLVNGVNYAINTTAGSYFKITSGPTGGFSIDGISGTEDGRRILIHNATGYEMTVANQSGGEPTASSRIITQSGTDEVVEFADLIYDANSSRWRLINHEDDAGGADLPSITGTGIAVRTTAAPTYTTRTITAGSSKITVTNGDGVSGNPTIDATEANFDLANIGGTLDLSTQTSGTLQINQGGSGQTTQTSAFDALAPTTTKGDIIVHNGSDNIRLAVSGNDGYVLAEDSTEASGVKWVTAGGHNAVTISGGMNYVGLTTQDLNFSEIPLATDVTGTLDESNIDADIARDSEVAAAYQPLDAELTAVAGLASNGVVVRTGAGTAAVRTITAGSNKISITNGDGVAGAPTIDATEANFDMANIGGNLDVSSQVTGLLDEANIDADIARDTELHDAISLAGTYDYITIASQVLTRNQIDVTTDITGIIPNGNLDPDLEAIGDNSTSGLLTRTGAGSATGRTITGTASEITVTNGDGVSGNPTIAIHADIARDSELHSAATVSGAYDYITLVGQDIVRGQVNLGTDVTGTLDESNIDSDIARDSEVTSAVAAKQDSDSDLTAIAGITGTGMLTRTGAGTARTNTITAASSRVSVVNGNGVSGNTTIDVNEGSLNIGNMSGQVDLTSDVTGALPLANGGTGQTTRTEAFDALAPSGAGQGSLIYYLGTDWTEFPKGSNGQVLKVNTGVSGGLQWGSDSTGGSSLSYTSYDETNFEAGSGSGTSGDPYVLSPSTAGAYYVDITGGSDYYQLNLPTSPSNGDWWIIHYIHGGTGNFKVKLGSASAVQWTVSGVVRGYMIFGSGYVKVLEQGAS